MLNNEVVPLVCTRWYDLGLELFIQKDEEQVDIIENNNIKDGVQTCCKKMFTHWLTYDNCTWEQLIKAVRKIGLNHQASEIEKLLQSNGETIASFIVAIYVAS